MMKQADWRKMIDYFEKVTSEVENDKPSRDRMGWLREMYTFATAAVRIYIYLPICARIAHTFLYVCELYIRLQLYCTYNDLLGFTESIVLLKHA